MRTGSFYRTGARTRFAVIVPVLAVTTIGVLACGGGPSKLVQPTHVESTTTATRETTVSAEPLASPTSQIQPTATAIQEPTVVPSLPPWKPTPPSPSVQALLDSLYDVAWVERLGNTTFAVTKGLQEREECEDPEQPGEFYACSSLDSVQINVADFPEPLRKLEEGISYFYYRTWQAQTGSSLSFEQFDQAVRTGEGRFQIAVVAYDGASSNIGRRIASVSDPPIFVYVENNWSSFVGITTEQSYAFRVLNGQLIIEMFLRFPGGVANAKEQLKKPYKWQVATDIAWAMAIVADQPLQDQLSLLISGRFSTLDYWHRLIPSMYEFVDRFVVMDGANLQASTSINSIFRTQGTFRE